MLNEIRKKVINTKAREILQETQSNTLPISPITIAEKANISVQAKPDTERGVSGMLIKSGDNFGIMYATHIKNAGFQNFSIAHELGHYYLDGHIENILTDGVHASDERLSSTNEYEQEANYFASALLMPDCLIQNDIKINDLSWQLIRNISNKCQTSLEATARRVVGLSKEPCALLIHRDHIPWVPIKSSHWLWFLGKVPFPGQLDYCDYESLSDTMDECNLIDWGIENINSDEYQCKYSSICFKRGKTRIMTLLLLTDLLD